MTTDLKAIQNTNPNNLLLSIFTRSIENILHSRWVARQRTQKTVIFLIFQTFLANRISSASGPRKKSQHGEKTITIEKKCIASDIIITSWWIYFVCSNPQRTMNTIRSQLEPIQVLSNDPKSYTSTITEYYIHFTIDERRIFFV